MRFRGVQHNNNTITNRYAKDHNTGRSVYGVLRPLGHVNGTGCQHIYASVIVSDNLNGCSRLICLVLETAALCDISVRSAMYKSSYLLTYATVWAVWRNG